jgi:glycosyltransferase involved in cell wall biosynthesis
MNKIMEYMFFGLPIVCYELTEHRVSAQDAALYVQANSERALAEGISVLLDDLGRRSRMSDYGAKRVRESLAWQHSIPPLLAAYDTIFARLEALPRTAAWTSAGTTARDQGEFGD